MMRALVMQPGGHSHSPQGAEESNSPRGVAVNTITVADVTFAADPAGALYWPSNNFSALPTCTSKKGRASRAVACSSRPTTPAPPCTLSTR